MAPDGQRGSSPAFPGDFGRTAATSAPPREAGSSDAPIYERRAGLPAMIMSATFATMFAGVAKLTPEL